MAKAEVDPQVGGQEFTLASNPHAVDSAFSRTQPDLLTDTADDRTVAVPSISGGDGDTGELVQLPTGAALRDRFTTLELIGQGGMGDVLRVVDSVLQRDLAMKVIKPEVELEPALAARFLAEAQVTAQLDHPSIVPVHDLGSSEGGRGLFFTMKRVSGTTLSQLLKQMRGNRPGQEDLKRLVSYLVQVCYALEFAHARGVIHCDLKPGNIMIGNYGQVYLMDWGVAVVKGVPCGRDTQLEVQSTSGLGTGDEVCLSQIGSSNSPGVVGTPAYMAPEQALGEPQNIDARTDVYGLGGVLCEVLTGSPPNRRSNPPSILPGVLPAEPREFDCGELWDELPPGLVAVAQRALNRDPQQRYCSVRALRKDLESFLEGGGWFQAQHVKRGEVIVRQGEHADTAYIIEQGSCEVFVDGPIAPRSVGQLGPGDVFGETAALSTGVRTATVVALDDVVVRVVTRESLENELSRNPWLSAFVRALGERFREAERRLSDRAPNATDNLDGAAESEPKIRL